MTDIKVDSGDIITYEGDLALCVCNEPTLYVSVTDNTSNVTWCGKTWTPAESGDEKEICNIAYNEPGYFGPCGDASNTGLCGSNEGGAWGVVTDQLQMQASWRRNIFLYEYPWTSPTISWITGTAKALHTLDIGAYKDSRFQTTATIIGVLNSVFAFSTTQDDLGMINTISPFVGTLSSAYFGSFTDASGVTYAWRKGNGWT